MSSSSNLEVNSADNQLALMRGQINRMGQKIWDDFHKEKVKTIYS